MARKQELQDKQQAIIHKELQFLQGVHDQTRQIYTDLSQAAAPEAAQGIALFEANNRTKILSAIDHIVDQSVSQATQLLPDAVREEAPSSPKLNSSQQPAVNPTQAPSTPSQPSTQQFPGSFHRQPSRSVGIKRTHSQVSSQLNASHKNGQHVQQAASMPPVSLLLTRLTKLDVAQQMQLPDAELDRDALAYVGNWARELWIASGKAQLLQDGRDGSWQRVTFKDSGRMRPYENACFRQYWEQRVKQEPDWAEKVMNSHRIRYSAAFRGASEVGVSHQDDTWTYPAMARKLIEKAFEQAKLNPRLATAPKI